MARHIDDQQFGIDDRCDLLEARLDLRWERRLADAIAAATDTGELELAAELAAMQAFTLDEWIEMEDVYAREAPAA